MRLRPSLALATAVLGLVLAAPPARAAEFYAYRAKVSVALTSATSEDGATRFATVRLSSKRLLNAALGRPLGQAVPRSLALVVVLRRDLSTYLGAGLGILDRSTGTFTRVASMTSLGLLATDVPDAPAAGVGEASVAGLPLDAGPDGELRLDVFAVFGAGRGRLVAKDPDPAIALDVTGLHARVVRRPPSSGAATYPATIVTDGRLRASGTPLAILELPDP